MFERRAEQWLQHLQWAMDHLQHRLELSGQIAWGLFAGQGVLAAFLVSLIGAELRPAWFAYTGSAAVLAVAMLVVMYAVVPRDTRTIEPAQYAQYWADEIRGTNPFSVPAMFIEEFLQSKTDGLSAHTSLRDAINRRYELVRRAVWLTMSALLLLLVGACLEILPSN